MEGITPNLSISKNILLLVTLSLYCQYRNHTPKYFRMVVHYTSILYSIIVRAKMVCIDYRIMIYSIEWAIVVMEEKKNVVELYSMKIFYYNSS